MSMPRRLALSAFIALAIATASAQADETTVSEAPYPGTMKVAVDATDLSRRIIRVTQEIPVRPGPMTLQYPKWLPGGHSPEGPIVQLAGLMLSGNGQNIGWKRDPLDVYRFNLRVPEGVDTLHVEFQFLSPTERNQGRIVVTPEIIGLQWNALLLYPAGHAARAIQVEPKVKLPVGWKFGSALEVASQTGGDVSFKSLDLEMLVDSPLFAGKHYQQFDLDPGGKVPVRLNVVADTPEALEAKPEFIAKHRELVRQADKLYGSRHFAHYDFLLALSNRFSGIGLEHHQSSENGVGTDYFTDDKSGARDLLAHEYTHSWNGKFRRGADLITPNYNVPMQNTLLWVYEGQTQYWGYVLAARAGLLDAEQVRDTLASVAASYEHREGRAWRDLEDTTWQPIITDRGPMGWRSWQRGEDYYSEGQLVWLDVDSLIREKSGGKRSLDDFARAFFGVENGRVRPLGYTIEEVAQVLNGVQAHDWLPFLRARIDSHGPGAPLDGLARSGWKLVYNDKQGKSSRFGGSDFTYSLGLSLGKDNKLGDVLWNSPAFKAGLASGQTLVAVNGEAANADRLKQAVIDGQKSGKPIVLLVNNLDRIDTVTIVYKDGLRYPHLERIPNTPDRLADILKARK